jgi:hypothetical protein
LFLVRFLRSYSIPCPQAASYDSSCVSYPTMRLLFTSLIRSSANVSVTVIIRITHCFPLSSESSLQCIGSSSNGSDSRENIKTFDRLNHFNFGRFARPLASLVPRTPPYNHFNIFALAKPLACDRLRRTPGKGSLSVKNGVLPYA